MNYKKWLWVIAISVACLALIERYSRLPEALPEDSVSAALLTPGFYHVGAHPIKILDKSRFLTTKNGARIARKFIGKLWFPMIEDGLVAPGAHPLVIYQHSYNANYAEFSDTAQLLASRGYLVLATTTPMSHVGSSMSEFIGDTPEQTQDTHYILDTLARWNESPETLFYNRINFNRIATVGYSVGGTQSLLNSFHPRFMDKRIGLTVIAGGFTELFEKAFFNHRKNHPLLAITADGDRVSSFKTNALPLIEKHPNAWLVSIDNGSHAGFFQRSRWLRWLPNPDIINCRELRQAIKQLSTKNADFSVLGSTEEGIVSEFEYRQCIEKNDISVNPLEQYRLTQLSLISFIEMHFADTEFERNSAADFISHTLSQENQSVHYIKPIKADDQ